MNQTLYSAYFSNHEKYCRYKEKGDHLSGDALLFEKGANQDDLVLAENPEDEGDLFKAEENVEKYLEKLERNQQVPSAMQNYWVSTLRLPDGGKGEYLWMLKTLVKWFSR